MLRRTLVLAIATVAVSPAAAPARQASTSSSPAPTPSVSPAPNTPAVIPPDLQTLERAMLALPINSERFTASIGIGGSVSGPSGPLGGFGGRALRARASARKLSFDLIDIAGEQSFVPQEASFEASFLGFKTRGRLIGTTLYLYEPFIAHLDGGRPWVEEPNQRLEQATGLGVTALGGKPDGLGAVGLEGKPDSGAARAFGGLVEMLGEASSIQELGPATVDNVPTTAFKVSAELDALTYLSTKQKRDFRKLFKPLLHFELFIAASGLPVRVRSRASTRKHHFELIVQQDTLAINEPVDVQAPPADKTITQAELKRLEQAQIKKLERRLRRSSRHRHRRK